MPRFFANWQDFIANACSHRTYILSIPHPIPVPTSPNVPADGSGRCQLTNYGFSVMETRGTASDGVWRRDLSDAPTGPRCEPVG